MEAKAGSKRGGSATLGKEGDAVTPTTLTQGLYIVATPIGNARDITLRAMDVLTAADVLVAEDTRVTAKLLAIHGIERRGRPFLAYHDRNGAQMRPKILARVAAGEAVAYCSDAGTPLIADPGYRLVAEAQEMGLPVMAVPGTSAVTAALAVAGLPTDRFLFLGFLPAKSGPRRTALAEIASVRATLVLFESPRRLPATLVDLCDVLGVDRQAAVLRELTKRYEEIRRGSLETLAADFAGDEPIKGEIALVIAPASRDAVREADPGALDAALTRRMAEQSVKDAARLVSAEFGLPRKQVYERALRLRDQRREKTGDS